MSLIAMVPFLAAIILSAFLAAPAVKISVWLIGFVMASAAHIIWVPLVSREKTDDTPDKAAERAREG